MHTNNKLMANILITAPWLDEKKTVSGISTVVRTILESKSRNKYYHFRLGKSDCQKKDLKWLADQALIVPRLLYNILKFDIQLIHLNITFEKKALLRDYIVFFVVKRICNKPVLLHMHGGFFLMKPFTKRTFFWRLVRSMLRGADINLVLSDLEKDQITKNYEVRTFCLPNAVMPLQIALKKDFQNKLILIFLGRIVQSKGIYLLASALAELEDFYDQFELHIYGAGNDLSDFLKILQNIEKLNFKYFGVVQGNEKADALSNSHIFLLPSISSEGLPMALLEAMNTGCVVVVSDDASITSVVQNEYNGFIAAKGNKEILKNILSKIFLERGILEQIGSQAKLTIAERFDIKNYMIMLQ
jgi:glycosyltransferase involved in cell wall biosynthesis